MTFGEYIWLFVALCLIAAGIGYIMGGGNK